MNVVVYTIMNIVQRTRKAFVMFRLKYDLSVTPNIRRKQSAAGADAAVLATAAVVVWARNLD